MCIRERDFDIHTHKLFEGGESSGPTPLAACRPRILDQPIIPEKITVHLGLPFQHIGNCLLYTSELSRWRTCSRK